MDTENNLSHKEHIPSLEGKPSESMWLRIPGWVYCRTMF
jgi:hypothetical protein